MKTFITLLMTVVAFQINTNAQQNFNQSVVDNSVVMTWNKNTPEQEMKDDIKALKTKNGVTIKYSNLKRNTKNEITNIKVEFADNEGNSGNQEYNNKNAIPEIKFYKINGEIGFGNPNNNEFNDKNMSFQSFDLNDLKKQLSSNIKIDTLGNNKIFSFNFNDDKNPSINKKSKIIIQKDGRKPLVIEDGKVTEGADDYSKEEIEKFENDNKFNYKNDSNNLDFNKLDMNNLFQQIESLKDQFQQNIPKGDKNENDSRISKSSKSDQEDLKKEMRDARDEMIKAKKELEEAKKEVLKSKTQMKTQKI